MRTIINNRFITSVKEKIFFACKLIFSFINDVLTEYKQDHGTLFAAAISFFGLISFIPLLLLGVGVFGYIIGSHDRAFETVISSSRNYLPISSNDIEIYLKGLTNQSNFLSGIGLLGLLWAGTQVFVILQQVMNVALDVHENIGFIRGRSKAIIVVAIAGLLFIFSIILTSFITAASHYKPLYIRIDEINVFWNFLGILIPILMSVLAFTLIYKYLPTRRIGTIAPLLGGITAGLLFETAKYIYRIYVLNFTSFHAVYGSLGSVVLLIIWTYYVSVIAILGAEVASTYVKYRLNYLKEQREIKKTAQHTEAII